MLSLNSKILLTILPVFWPNMPPIGLGFLQSYLGQNGIEADILDLNNIFYRLVGSDLKKEWLISCNAALEKKILSIMRNSYPQEYQAAIDKLLGYEVVGFSCFKSNFKSTLEVIKYVKSKRKDTQIILGGPEITRQFLKGQGKFSAELLQLADLLVVGEGEKPLYGYLKNKKMENKITKFQELQNLDELAFPKYKGLKLADYPKKDSLPLQFSRGCIRICSFCSERLLYKGFRARSVAGIIDEIKYHKENSGTKYFVFFDSLINADLAKLEKLCDQITKHFDAINWEAQIAIRNDRPQALFEKIKRSGCYNLFVGLESGSDNTLGKMRKGFSAKEASGFFHQLNQAGLTFGISMIVGYPGETDADFKESLQFLSENKASIPKIEQVNPFTYYDGTDADEKGDYRLNRESLEKMKVFVAEIKRHNFKYTNAFLGNLLSPSGILRNKNDGI